MLARFATPVLARARLSLARPISSIGMKAAAEGGGRLVSVKAAVPYVSLAVSLTALGFQIGVLYPWHEELSHDFKGMMLHVERITSRVRENSAAINTVAAETNTDIQVLITPITVPRLMTTAARRGAPLSGGADGTASV